MAKREYQAIFEGVESGDHGPYGVTRCDEMEGSITIHLTQKQVDRGRVPDNGTFLILSDLRRKPDGWRAQHWRYMRPSDEKNSKSKQNQHPERSKKHASQKTNRD